MNSLRERLKPVGNDVGVDDPDPATIDREDRRAVEDFTAPLGAAS